MINMLSRAYQNIAYYSVIQVKIPKGDWAIISNNNPNIIIDNKALKSVIC